MIVLLIILLAAVFTDYRQGKIPNWMIIFGIGSGLVYCILCYGAVTIPDKILAIILPIVLLYPAFAIGGLGAGDLKLFAVCGSYLGIRGILFSICFAFVIGAILSIIKMIHFHNFKERIYYFFSYVSDIFLKGKWQLYETSSPNVLVCGDCAEESLRFPKHKIHFAPAILWGVVIYIGGTL